MDDALADEKRTDDELGASSSVPAKRKGRAESDLAEQHPDTDHLSLPNLDGDDSERVETAPHKKAKLETDAGDVSNELPAVSGSEEAQKPSIPSPLVMPKAPSTSRVPHRLPHRTADRCPASLPLPTATATDTCTELLSATCSAK